MPHPQAPQQDKIKISEVQALYEVGPQLQDPSFSRVETAIAPDMFKSCVACRWSREHRPPSSIADDRGWRMTHILDWVNTPRYASIHLHAADPHPCVQDAREEAYEAYRSPPQRGEQHSRGDTPLMDRLMAENKQNSEAMELMRENRQQSDMITQVRTAHTHTFTYTSRKLTHT